MKPMTPRRIRTTYQDYHAIVCRYCARPWPRPLVKWIALRPIPLVRRYDLSFITKAEAAEWAGRPRRGALKAEGA